VYDRPFGARVMGSPKGGSRHALGSPQYEAGPSEPVYGFAPFPMAGSRRTCDLPRSPKPPGIRQKTRWKSQFLIGRPGMKVHAMLPEG